MELIQFMHSLLICCCCCCCYALGAVWTSPVFVASLVCARRLFICAALRCVFGRCYCACLFIALSWSSFASANSANCVVRYIDKRTFAVFDIYIVRFGVERFFFLRTLTIYGSTWFSFHVVTFFFCKHFISLFRHFK